MDILLVHTVDTYIVSVREHIAIRNFGTLIGKAFDKLLKTGATCVGPPLTVYHSPVSNPEDTDLEVGFPVRPEDKYTRILVGCVCASGLHSGDYALLYKAHKQIAGWIRLKGYTISGPPFEVYLNDPREVPVEELLTQVYFPVKTSL